MEAIQAVLSGICTHSWHVLKTNLYFNFVKNIIFMYKYSTSLSDEGRAELKVWGLESIKQTTGS